MLQAKEMMEQRKAARAVRAAQLDAQIAEQRAAITKMERELEASGQVCGIDLVSFWACSGVVILQFEG